MLLSLALLVAGVWVASRWWYVSYTTQTVSWSIDRGMTVHSYDPEQWQVWPSKLGWHFNSIPSDGQTWTWWFGWEFGTSESRSWGLYSAYDFSARESKSSFHSGISLPPSEFICLWPLPLLLTLAGVPLMVSGVRARRRGLAGACPTCGYDRRGIPPASPCPECGKANGTQMNADKRGLNQS